MEVVVWLLKMENYHHLISTRSLFHTEWVQIILFISWTSSKATEDQELQLPLTLRHILNEYKLYSIRSSSSKVNEDWEYDYV